MNIFEFYSWLLLSFVFFTIELCFPTYFFILALGLGSFAAAVASLFVVSVTLQCVIAFFISVSAFVLLSVLCDRTKLRCKYVQDLQTLSGKRGIVESILPDKVSGYAIVGGRFWLVRCISGEFLLIGDTFEVIDIVGAHLRVRKCEPRKGMHD